MNEEPQVRGCYNITFICTPTNQETVSVLEKTQAKTNKQQQPILYALQCELNTTPYTKWNSYDNRRFPEITGEDNLTMFSYSWRVKSPEWRRQRRRADLRQFQIFRHGPIIIYTRLPAGGT